MNYQLGALISFMVAFQFFFVAIYLCTNKKGVRRNNRILGLLFFVFSISLFDFTLRVSEVFLPIPLLHQLDDGFFFLYGPLIYFYVKGVVFSDFRFKITNVLHLIPFLIYTAFISYHLMVTDISIQADVTRKINDSDLPIWVFLINLIYYIHILTYLWFGWQNIGQYRTVIKDQFSSIDEINLEWLSFMIKAFATITVVAMIHNTIPIFGNIIVNYVTLALLLVAAFYFISQVLVKALNQPAIFSGIPQKEAQKYASSNLTEETLTIHKTALQLLMEEEQLYLDPDLTSQQLAERMDIPPKTLSQVINQGFHLSFFDLVNSYRCEEVKRILKGPDPKITILEAMYQAGFNSKSSFNKEFKKLTGQTPSEFKRS